MMRIPLVDLVSQYRAIKPEIDRAIQSVVERGQFILGPEVEALEREVAAYGGASEAVGVASGTDALALSLRACGVGAGDEVATSALSFFATAEAILAVGATPVFVDIDPATYTLDPAQLDVKITPRTKAILPVHLYGHPCAMEPILRIAARRALPVIEDAAQAIGAEYRGRKAGSLGVAGAFSFFPSKNLGAYGDGGMVVTNDRKVAETIRLLRVHGSRERYRHVAVGMNSRLDELQAAVLRVKLQHLDAWTESRRRHAQTYRELFARHGLSDLVLPEEASGCRHVYHLFVIRTRHRAAIARALEAQGIGCQVTYPATLPQQPALVSLASAREAYPVAEAAASEVLSLPCYPELTPALIEDVVSTIAQAAAPRGQ